MSNDTQPSAVKPGTAPAVVPALARDVTPGQVLHTFDGDIRIENIHTTLSGFRLLEFADRPLRPCHPEDIVYLVAEGGAA